MTAFGVYLEQPPYLCQKPLDRYEASERGCRPHRPQATGHRPQLKTFHASMSSARPDASRGGNEYLATLGE
jgi:hypothetical protein